MNQVNYFLLAALGVAIAAAAYFAGKSGNEASATAIQSNQPQVEQTIPRKPNTQTPPKGEITSEVLAKPNNQTPQKVAFTPEAIAKAKNVPATLNTPQGVYTLVTVVEGVDANSRLDKSLQVVGDQRNRLAALSQQLDKTPADLVEQRQSIAAQIKKVKKALEYNLRIMVQNYGYSLKKNYLRVPHEASLLSVTKVDGKVKTEKVHAFKNSEDYDDFVEKLDVYLRLKLEQAKAEPPSAVLVKEGIVTPMPESDPATKQGAKLAPTLEMDAKSKELQQLYNYDTGKNYQIRLEKTALYVSAARAIQAKKAIPPRTIPPKTNTQTPQKRTITPEAIAKAKNVPATLNTPQGVYTLVAVVEGANSNRRLYQGLQVVGDQRQRLTAASQQFEKTPASSVQQRELIAGQINEIKKEMEDHLRIMAQNYGYSLKNNYTKVPHVVSLLSVTEVDGEAKAESVHVFKNPRDYEDFQKKRADYLRLKVEQVSAAKKKTKLAPTPEMNVKSKELQRLYKYDPEKTYQIRIEKTALYARAAR